MLKSDRRILTTHTGSLPRPEDLVRIMFAKEDGVPLDPDALDNRLRTAVAELADRQTQVGIDIRNDGEVSKPNYATYIKDRLTGFAGAQSKRQVRDLEDFPDVGKRVMGDRGRSRRRMPACSGPITLRDAGAAQIDIDNLQAAVGNTTGDAFMTAASPGVVGVFFDNEYYPDYESYLYAIGDAMRSEYQAIVDAGFILQVDCPDLAMGDNMRFAGMTIDEFRKMARLHIEVLNHALDGMPPDRLRMHLCWGNYDGPHHYDIELAAIIDLVFDALPSAISFEAANPRHAHEWTLFETVKLPAGKILIPGVIETKNNYIEHPDLVAQRIGNYARLVGRENVIAGVDCGFGTSVGSQNVDPGIVWEKLRTLAEGARRASKKFW